ncbi:MAG: hypothetical protein RL701_4191, partial [Pseudomonadota bacterium]
SLLETVHFVSGTILQPPRLCQAGRAPMVSLWDMLTVICGAAVLGSSLGSVQARALGHAGLITALGAAIMFACLSVAAIRLAGHRASLQLRHASSERAEAVVRTLYIGAMVWILATSGLGAVLTSTLLRLVF